MDEPGSEAHSDNDSSQPEPRRRSYDTKDVEMRTRSLPPSRRTGSRSSLPSGRVPEILTAIALGIARFSPCESLRPGSFASIIANGTRRLILPRAVSDAGGNSNALVLRQNGYLKDTGKGAVVITIVLVEAKGLPRLPEDSHSQGVYCKFQLGKDLLKSKTVTSDTRNPTWGQQFKLNYQNANYLKISLWERTKQKNFMGSCILDISKLEIERTHKLRQDLDDGFGSVHFTITMCVVKNSGPIPPVSPSPIAVDESVNKYAWYNMKDLDSVGQLHVKVISAKGLSGKPNAYCVLGLDNERVQTHYVNSTPEPVWNKEYLFNIHDATSSLDIRIQDNSLINRIYDDFLGRITIPLLRITHNETRWFALKDKSNRTSAKGNCPRILLELNMVWNPVKATLKMFRPKEVKHIAKPKKFDIALVYSNVEFIRDTFLLLDNANENIKQFLEWDNSRLCKEVLAIWLVFWFYFQVWMIPLLLAAPFVYLGLFHKDDMFEYKKFGENRLSDEQSARDEKSLTKRVQELPEMTLTITNGIEYMAGLAERLYNLATFKVPFLSVVTLLLLAGCTCLLAVVPVNYLLMAFGLYKFGRKYLNPDRELNNDLADFLSHIPDTDILKNWRELNVPEPPTPKTTSAISVEKQHHSDENKDIVL